MSAMLICISVLLIVLIIEIIVISKYSKGENFDINSRIYMLTKVAETDCQNAVNKKECINSTFNLYSRYLL
jgi:hypothetical protein